MSLQEKYQCARSSKVPSLDNRGVETVRPVSPVGHGHLRSDSNLRLTDGRTDRQTMANSIVPLPHFVRRGTIK